MANICDVCYKCVGDSKEIESLYNVLQSMNKPDAQSLENDYGNMWLGNLVHKLGGDWQKYRCRGEITDYSLTDGMLIINQFTAWCEQEGVRQIITEKFPSIKVYFEAMELDNEVFYTNDSTGTYFPYRYMIETECDCEEFTTLSQAAQYASKILGKELPPDEQVISAALDKYTSEQDDDHIAVLRISHLV